MGTELAELESRTNVHHGVIQRGEHVFEKDMLQRVDALLDRIETVFLQIRSKELSTPIARSPRMHSRLSHSSEDALGKLGETNRILVNIETRVQEVVQEIK